MMNKKLLLLATLTLIVVTIVFGTIYVTQQQSLRISANSPQIQLAEDMAAALNSGVKPSDAIHGKIDLNNSLAAFVIIYDKSGHVVDGNGDLDNVIPIVPLGVLQHSNGREYSFVTWQPQATVRLASVSVAANNYYVLSGRSLKETEKQAQAQLQLALFGWLCSVATVLGGAYVYSRLGRTSQTKSS